MEVEAILVVEWDKNHVWTIPLFYVDIPPSELDNVRDALVCEREYNALLDNLEF